MFECYGHSAFCAKGIIKNFFKYKIMQNKKNIFIYIALLVMALQLASFRLLTAFAYSAGSVVINEIAWAGSSDNSNDEWIELYNTTTDSIDLTNWYIEDDVTASVYKITSGEIAPHGYFLIEDTEVSVNNITADSVTGLSLANAGDSLVLKDSSGAIVDTVNGSGGKWYAGDSVSKATMERIDPKVTADNSSNWASAINPNGALGRTGTSILGTPKGANSTFSGSGPEVSVAPAQSSVKKGDNLTLSVEVDKAVDLYSYGFEINYDPSVLDFSSAKESDFLKIDGESTSFNYALENGEEGVIVVGNARLVNPPKGVDGSGQLFDLTFKIIGDAGKNTSISFDGENFLTDSSSDIQTKFNNGNVAVESGGLIEKVSNLQIAEDAIRYNLKLSWTAPLSGADSYQIKKKLSDGSFVLIGETSDKFFVDSNNLIPTVIYTYQVISVKNGSQSEFVQINGSESRGIKGDIDRSDRIDGRDIEKLARSFGSGFGDEEYEALNDTNFDGVIDGSDLIDIGANFGKTY